MRETISDGERIARVLAAELDGLARGPLVDVRVSDANPDVAAAPDGARAFSVGLGDGGGDRRDTGEGRPLATATVYPDHLRLAFERGGDAAAETAERLGLPVERPADGPAAVVDVEVAAMAKRTADVVVAAAGACAGER
ncbi:MAG: hypothetical protein ABEJ70_02725 [Halobacteriaceae archaeon]